MSIKKLANIYVIHHGPYKNLQSEILTPIYTKKDIIPNSLSSDIGDHIANENPLYAEYSTFYWVWKNQIPYKYTGFFQYRRYISLKDNVTNLMDEKNMEKAIEFYGFNEKTLNSLLDKYDIILPNLVIFPGYSVISHYLANNPGSIYMDSALEIIKSKYPDYVTDFHAALSKNCYYSCNMFILRTDIFNNYMNWIMDIFNELKIKHSPPNTVKVFAYLGERLFNVFLNHLNRTENIRIKVNPWMYLFPTANNSIDFRLIQPNFSAL